MKALTRLNLIFAGSALAISTLGMAHAQPQMAVFRAIDDRPDRRIYVQEDFPRVKGGAELLTYTEWNQPQMTPTGKKHISSISEISIRCADRNLMHRTDILRSGRSGTGETVQRMSHPREWIKVPEETTAALLLKMACDWTPENVAKALDRAGSKPIGVIIEGGRQLTSVVIVRRGGANPLVNRPHNDMPLFGLISFWPKRVLSLRAGYRERQDGQSKGLEIMEFEWDSPKAVSNVRKHGVTFDEAATVFLE